jgi:PIN domain nuclease of toxin-antitoxin system
VNILLDTHVALWAITDSPRLPASAKTLIQAERTIVWISVVSLWEIAIKHGLGRGAMPISGQAAFDYFQQSGFRFLSIAPEHALAVAELPAHHQDPFDRLLIAQALTEPLRLVTHDQTVARYSEHIVFV